MLINPPVYPTANSRREEINLASRSFPTNRMNRIDCLAGCVIIYALMCDVWRCWIQSCNYRKGGWNLEERYRLHSKPRLFIFAIRLLVYRSEEEWGGYAEWKCGSCASIGVDLESKKVESNAVRSYWGAELDTKERKSNAVRNYGDVELNSKEWECNAVRS